MGVRSKMPLWTTPVLRQLAGVKQITAEYIKTPKNDLAKEFWLKMGFEKVEENAAASSWRKKLEHYTARKFEYLSFAK